MSIFQACCSTPEMIKGTISTIDGRTWANQLIGRLSHYLQSLISISGGVGFQPLEWVGFVFPRIAMNILLV